MEYMVEEEKPQQLKNKILCCECGTAIDPNPANMCAACLRSHVDITQDIPKQATLYFCRGCERYLQPPGEWIHCTLESRNAAFVWTEPHSKRIKVKLTVHGEVMGGAILEQVFIVDYTVNHQMCDTCHRSEAQDYWRASVQVRQKSENKKTFYYLEQLILKHKAHENTLGIKPAHVAELSSTNFWRYPFNSICNPKQLVEYIVMDIECIMYKDKKSFPGQGSISTRHVTADIWLVKASELGVNDNTIHTRTHLGHLLKPGDLVLGDYNEFLDDLEEDPTLRQNVNIFKDMSKQMPVDAYDTIDPDAPHITLDEMLDDLVIDDVEMAE
ncbi:nonsense-mediated mrna decay protein 3 [Holotrichia oblita]|uniref:Nonsense-mediated mrna decay protein 3 n=1 Tax=Holotrichia oblita TaxID=644536 RepID=A0ACB9SYV3_HOLOL|nr:nonsense-mediated mrna decay protein 3 [Holotrichia oblita]